MDGYTLDTKRALIQQSRYPTLKAWEMILPKQLLYFAGVGIYSAVSYKILECLNLVGLWDQFTPMSKAELLIGSFVCSLGAALLVGKDELKLLTAPAKPTDPES